MKAGFTIDLAESLTSAVFDELDRHGIEGSLPLVRWKMKLSNDGFVVEGVLARDDYAQIGARWALALGLPTEPAVNSDGSRVWALQSNTWNIVLIGRDDS